MIGKFQICLARIYSDNAHFLARSVERQRLIEKPRPPAAKGDGPRRSIWQRGARDGEPDGSTSGQGVTRRPGRNVRRRPRASLAVTSGQGRRRPPCGSTCRARRFLPGSLRHDERDAPPVCQARERSGRGHSRGSRPPSAAVKITHCLFPLRAKPFENVEGMLVAIG